MILIKKYLEVPVLVIIFGACTSKVSEDQTRLSRVDFKLATMEGEPISDQSFDKKTLILNVWATWCKPCIDEMPSLEKLMKKLPDNYILLVASNEDPEKIQRFIDRYDFDLEFIRLKDRPEVLGIDLYPTTFIFNAEGEILQTIEGKRDWESVALP